MTQTIYDCIMPLNQDKILIKINEYLVADGKEPICVPGMCLGFSTAWSYFAAIDQEELFWQYMQQLAEWRNNAKSDPLVTEFINAIIQFQYNNFYHPALLVDRPLKISTIPDVVLKWNFSKDELIECFTSLLAFVQKHEIPLETRLIKISNQNHACGLSYKKSNFGFYDPNCGEAKKTNTIMELVEYIYKSLATAIDYDWNTKPDLIQYICPLCIKIYPITTPITANAIENNSVYFRHLDFYEKFIKNRVGKLKASINKKSHQAEVMRFKIWTYYTITTNNPYIMSLLDKIDFKQFGFCDNCKFYEDYYREIYLDGKHIKSTWILPQLLFNIIIFATPLELSIRDDDPEKIYELLEKDYSQINAISEYYNATPLMQAAYLNKPNAVEALLQSKADLNITGDCYLTALRFSAIAENIEIVKILLNWQPNLNVESTCFLLLDVIASDQLEMCKLLLKHGVDPNCMLKCKNYLLPFLFDPAKENFYKLLLQYKLDPNLKCDDGNSLLHNSASRNNIEICQLLLSHHADINTLNIDKNSALHVAITARNEELALMLIDKGINLSLVNKDGNTALHLAAQMGRRKLSEKLLLKGANLNERNFAGKSPLILAIENNHPGLVEVFSDPIISIINAILQLVYQTMETVIVMVKGSDLLITSFFNNKNDFS